MRTDAPSGPPSFVHLHVHTHYSMLDGACKIPDLVARAKELAMPALAITDHGVMYGAIEFYNECKKQGVKPLIGVEAYVAPGDRRDRSTPTGNAGEAAYHLLLLAQDLEGYRNLMKLSRISFMEGYYYKPRIDKSVLMEHSRGLIATSSCLGGEVASALLKKSAKVSREAAEAYLKIFGPDRFFIEVQKHVPEQDQVNPELAELASKLGVGLVGTNDVHFLRADDYEAHNCLCCISTQKLHDDPKRMIYPRELYLKSPAEMQQALAGFKDAMSNTLRIAEMCDLELDFSKRYAPVYKVPATAEAGGDAASGRPTDERYLRELCERGLEWRYGTREVSQAVRDRLAHELRIISAKDFCSYFLIVWDFCNYAREQGIPVGARGSGVGTMVGYLLGLCNVDPIRYGLLFERFMDPSRNEMPDIDIDICQDGRARIIEYVREKYGHVAQIVTFGTLAAKAALKDVARVMGIDVVTSNKLTAFVPGTPGMTIDKALGQVPDLQKFIDENPRLGPVVATAKKLEGLCRNAGVHAAGVIIADQPLEEVIPLCRDKEGNVLTQYEGPIAEKCGLLKMDFLGLRTLSVVKRSVELAKKSGRVPADFDIEKIDLKDKQVLDLFCRGQTKGIFQFESGGMQDLLIKMRPDRLEDLIAANALYRPGPMELIPAYCDRKHGREPLPAEHPVMDTLLAETYGIMVYQEQVMQIFNQLGGIELSAAYKLIKAISKKQPEVIAKYKPEFINGTVASGVSIEKAEKLFALILDFGGYGFNKSHSTRYAVIAFQTAYMKTYHPLEYMAALLTYEMGSTDKVVEYIEECRRMKLKVLPPDVNESGHDFTPVYRSPVKGDAKRAKSAAGGQAMVAAVPGLEGFIRFGLAAVRGVGDKAVDSIVAEREKGGAFKSLFEFCDRIDTRCVQKSTIDALIRCGGFCSVHDNRAAMLHVLDQAFETAQRARQDRAAGQELLFGGPSGGSPGVHGGQDTLPNLPEFARPQLLQFEKELVGFYVTSHPLTEKAVEVETFGTHTTRGTQALPEGTELTLAGMITQVRARVGKSGPSAGKKWAIIEIEDLEGKIEAMVFAQLYESLTRRDESLVQADRVVLVRGKVDRKRETPCLVVNEITPIEEAALKATSMVALRVDAAAVEASVAGLLAPVLTAHRGGTETVIDLANVTASPVRLRLDKKHWVKPTEHFVREMEAVVGIGNVERLGVAARRRKQTQNAMFVDPEDVHPPTPDHEPED